MLFANHAYMFEKAVDGKLVFKNPWGVKGYDPLPLEPKVFEEFFDDIALATVPDEKSASAGK